MAKSKMVKSELIEIVAQKAHSTKKATKEGIDLFLNQIVKSLEKGEDVLLSGFGTFKVKPVEDKVHVLPDGERKLVKAHRKVHFIPGSPLKKAVW